MTRPIIRGIIGEVLAACSLGRIVNESVALAMAIKNGDPDLEGESICMMFDVSDYQATPKFWEDHTMMNNLVASVLERITMEVANPVLESIDGATHEDLAAICGCTDLLQIQAVPMVMERCSTMWTRLTIRRSADVRKEREAAMDVMGELDNLVIGMFGAMMAATHQKDEE